MAKKKSTPEPFWDKMVQVWFNFTKEVKNESPSFDGSAPRDLKEICKQLRTRCEDKGHIWDSDSAQNRLYLFFEEAYRIPFLANNWLLFQINRQKDIVFFNAAKSKKQNG